MNKVVKNVQKSILLTTAIAVAEIEPIQISEIENEIPGKTEVNYIPDKSVDDLLYNESTGKQDTMVDFERLEREKDSLRKQFLSAKPFPHIAIDDFLKEGMAEKLHDSAMLPDSSYKVKDVFFTKNKFQFPDIAKISSDYKKFYSEVTSMQFRKLIAYITDEDIFLDRKMYGGGLHMGAKNSYLDMHADFNYHPKHHNWFRNVNLLLYLNKDWKKEYGGSLKLKDARTGETTEVEPLLNRLAIMHCRDYTLHGYDEIHFPDEKYRTSIAMYGYTLHKDAHEKPRSTVWFAEDNKFKEALAKLWTPAVAWKKFFLG